MIRGCKNYFTLFGMMVTSINTLLHKFFTQISTYLTLYADIVKYNLNFELQYILQQNQIYKKDTYA